MPANTQTYKRTIFSQIVESKLIEAGSLTKNELLHLASISFTQAELMRKDTHSRRVKKPSRAAVGLQIFIRGFLSDLKNRPSIWFQKINGAVEDGRLVIKA
jgi:hypothetical protein